MRSFGLLAELVIDFTNGNPTSGLAEPNAKFVGTRAPDLAEVGSADYSEARACSETVGSHFGRTAENFAKSDFADGARTLF